MSIISDFHSAEELKRKIATDPETVFNLALFAHLLGFGWCGGTRSQSIGEDFDLIYQGSDLTMKAHYDPKDPYADGYMADQRLEIRFSNFRMDINGANFQYNPPRIISSNTLGIASYWAKNASSLQDSMSKSFAYSVSESVTHSAGVKVSSQTGVKVSASGGASVPFVADGRVTAEASLVVTLEGSYGVSKTRSTTTTHTAVYTGIVPPMSQRLIKLSVTQAEAEVDYTTEGVILFDVELSGFLRWGGNALRSHPTDRPRYSCHLMGSDGAFGALRWLAENDRPNASRWDLDWIRRQGWGGSLDAVLDFARRPPMRARLNGKFKIAAGIDATVIGGPAVPISDTPSEAVASAEVATLDEPEFACLIGVSEEPSSSFRSFGD